MTPVTQWTPEHVRALLPSVEASPWGPQEGPADVLAGAYLFDYQEGGAHALLAVRPVTLQRGSRLEVVGLVSLGDRLRGAALDRALSGIAQAMGAEHLAMCTKNNHVARQCERHGWQRSGVIMTRGAHGRQEQ